MASIDHSKAAPGSAEHRARDRVRRIVLSAVTSIASRLGSVGVTLLTIPMADAHLGPERFGMWMVVSSIGALLTFADLGIGNGIVNLVARASGTDRPDDVRAVVSSGFFVLVLLGSVLAGAMALAYPWFDWSRVFRVNAPRAIAEAGPSLLAFVIVFALGIPAGLGSKIQLGLQQGYLVNVWTGIGGFLSLVATVTAIRLGAGTPILVLALFGSQQLALLANTAVFLLIQRRDLLPRPEWVRRDIFADLFRLGSGFLLLQLVAVVAFRIDTLFVTQFFGPARAGVYATAERVFSLVSLLLGLMVAPLWPAFGEAVSRGEHGWVRQTLIRAVAASLAGSMIMVSGLCVFYPWILRSLLAQQTVVPFALILGFAVLKVFESVGNATAMFLNGIGALRVQTILAVIMGVTATGLKLAFAQRLGLVSFVWITAICYLFISVIPTVLISGRLLGQSGSRRQATASPAS